MPGHSSYRFRQLKIYFLFHFVYFKAGSEGGCCCFRLKATKRETNHLFIESLNLYRLYNLHNDK